LTKSTRVAPIAEATAPARHPEKYLGRGLLDKGFDCGFGKSSSTSKVDDNTEERPDEGDITTVSTMNETTGKASSKYRAMSSGIYQS
jgi:hypothetical protein